MAGDTNGGVMKIHSEKTLRAMLESFRTTDGQSDLDMQNVAEFGINLILEVQSHREALRKIVNLIEDPMEDTGIFQAYQIAWLALNPKED